MPRFWPAGGGLWMMLMLVEAVNGTIRRLVLDPRYGDVHARQIAVISGSALMLAVAMLTLPQLGRQPSRRWWQLGALWLLLTLVFEIGLGRLLGVAWDRIASDFDPRQGGLLAGGMLLIGAAPSLVARWRDLVERDKL